MSITKDEWLQRCAKRLIEKSEISESVAKEIAESLWEQRIDDSHPEDDADEEMTYWTD